MKYSRFKFILNKIKNIYILFKIQHHSFIYLILYSIVKMSVTLTLSGNSSELSADFFPPVELNGEYEAALVDFHSYNSIPNVDVYNNMFHIGDTVIELPVGLYELQDIVEFIREDYERDNVGKTIEIEANNNTMQIVIYNSHDPIYFDEENSIGKLLGFNAKTLEHGIEHLSDQPINIFKINLLRIECNIVVNTYINNSNAHTLHEFGVGVSPGYKIDESPRNLIYLPLNCTEISSLNVRIVDQDGDLINFRGEAITLRIHLRPKV